MRLYNCPNCDGFIEEDLYHEHAAACRPRPLICEMTDDQLFSLVSERDRRDPQWHEVHERIRNVAVQAVETWETSSRLRTPMIATQAVVSFVPEWATKPPIADYQMNTVKFKLHPALKHEEAVALVIDQLYELTGRDDLRV